MFYPIALRFSGRLDGTKLVLIHMRNAIANPINVLLDRHKHVAQYRRAPGPRYREHVRKPVDLQSQKSPRTRFPNIGETRPSTTHDVDFQQRPSHRIEPGRKDQRIELVRGDSALVLTRGVEGWKLNSPVVDGADQDAVERYLRNLQESEREKTIVDSAAVTDSEVVKYGLDTPRLSVVLHTEDGVEKKVDFGIDSPTDRFTYARIDGGNPEIFVLRAWRFDNLDKSVFDLRDRRVLAFAKDEVVEVRRSGVGGDCLLYTSPSPRDQRGSRVPAGAW